MREMVPVTKEALLVLARGVESASHTYQVDPRLTPIERAVWAHLGVLGKALGKTNA
jgi:hypothetical protein